MTKVLGRSRYGQGPVWQFEREDPSQPHGLGVWEKFDNRMQRLLRLAHKSGDNEVETTRGGVVYVVSLDFMTQVRKRSYWTSFGVAGAFLLSYIVR